MWQYVLIGISFVTLVFEYICLAETSPKSSAPIKFDCQLDLAAPLGLNGGFDNEDVFFYHLAQIERTRHSNASSLPFYRYKLIAIHIGSHKLKTLMSIKLPKINGMIVYGQPVIGILTVAFNDYNSACHIGNGYYAAIGLSASNRQLQIHKNKGFFSFSGGKNGLYLYDLQKKHVIEIDFNSMQSRSHLFELPANEIPLYIDLGKKHLYAWHQIDNKSLRGLIAYDGGSTPIAKVQFARGDKLLHDGKLFGVAVLHSSENKIDIIELAKWSGSKQTETYQIFLQKNFLVNDSAIDINFKKNMALIYGFTPDAKRKWKKIMLFDYKKSAELASLAVEDGFYVKSSFLANNGETVIAEVARLTDDLTAYYSIFSVKTRKWKNLSIPDEKTITE